jgi:hypothetical protein
MRLAVAGQAGFRRVVPAALLCLVTWFGAAAWARDAANGNGICESDEDDPKPAWKQFALAGACIELSGSANFIYQKLMDTKGGRIPALTSRRGAFLHSLAQEAGSSAATGPTYLNTGNVSGRVDTTRKTALGDLTAGFEVKYERTTNDSGNGTLTLTEGIASLAGVSVGYTDSLMNFWNGDFQSSATVPQRTVGVVHYERKITETLSFTLAAETGVPSAPNSGNAFMPIFWDDPVLAARLRSETDDLTVQFSGMVHQLKESARSAVLPPFRATSDARVWGWAATFGLTRELPKVSDGSEFSLQATYAVNASPYLGTAVDLSTLASLAPAGAETRGWSVVGSFHHVWSAHWESNAMASHLSLDITLPFAQPKIDSTRYAANLIWKPAEGLKLGGEIGWLDIRLDPHGAVGILRGISGKALVGYLFATWEF